jgi:uncharacterized membrane protein YkvA (DUF1232 family)
MENWKQRARQLKGETYAIFLAYKDPRTPWYAKLLAALVVGYAFSPIDLIPDPIPVLGYLDDLILVPLGIALALKMIPEPVLSECRVHAQSALEEGKPTNRAAAIIIVTIWLMLLAAAIALMVHLLRS